MLLPTITSEPLIIVYLTRSWGNLSSNSPLEVVWRVMERCVGSEWSGARQRTATAPCCACTQVVGGDACSNHHYRAAKHHVLGTPLGQSKLRIALEGRMECHGEV